MKFVALVFLFSINAPLVANASADNRCSQFITQDPRIVALIIKDRKKIGRDSGKYVSEPDPVKIKGVMYEILSFLGEGVQGEVYLARRTGNAVSGFVTIKYFSDVPDARLHAKLMRILGDNDVRSVKVFESRFSRDEPVIVQEYVEGMTLDRVLSRENPLDLSRNAMADIKRKRRTLFQLFDRIRSQSREGDFASELSWRDYNVIYEFSTGDLVIIDGR